MAERQDVVHAEEPYAFPTLEQYRITRYREWTRAVIAGFVLLIVAGIVIASFLSVFKPPEKVNMPLLEKLLDVIFGPLITLVSAATGFYFGSRSNAS